MQVPNYQVNSFPSFCNSLERGAALGESGLTNMAGTSTTSGPTSLAPAGVICDRMQTHSHIFLGSADVIGRSCTKLHHKLEQEGNAGATSWSGAKDPLMLSRVSCSIE